MANIDVKEASSNEGAEINDIKTVSQEPVTPDNTISEEAPVAATTPEAPSEEAVSDTAVAPEASTEPADTPQAASTSEDNTPVSPEPVAPLADKPHHNSNRVHLVVEVALAILVVVLALWGWSAASDRNNLKKQLSQANANPQAIVEKQSQELIAKVGRLM